MQKNYLVLIGVAVFLILGWFYWFQWRPSDIRKNCAISSKELAISAFKKRVDLDPDATEQEKNHANNGAYAPDDREKYYNICLVENGLDK